MASHPAAAPLGRYDVISARAAEDERLVIIQWGDGHISRFPFIWLRHQEYFPALGRPEQEEEAPFRLPEDPETLHIGDLSFAQGRLEIFWAHDGSRTQHDWAWLRDHCLSLEARRIRQPKPIFWQAAEAAAFPWFDAADLQNPPKRLEILQRLRDYGIVCLRNLPPEPGRVVEAAEIFGPIRRTHHGTLFSIRSLPEDRMGAGEKIGATASNAQAPHTDEGFRHNPLGIMFFHCLKAHPQGSGASLFVDGVGAAEALRQRDQEAFDFLTTRAFLLAAERNPLERFRTRSRLIALDGFGVVRGVKFADRTLPPPDLALDEIEPAYRALRAFSEALYDPVRLYERLLEPGDLVIFDNQRVLHARRAFAPEAGERHIQQVSVDREEFQSRLRQLAEQLNCDDLIPWEPDAGVLTCG